MKKIYTFFALTLLSQLTFAQPTNDNCTSAENITVSTSETTINFTIANALINNEVGCTGTSDDYGDIWYEFTMPVNGNLYITPNTWLNLFALYDSCSGNQIQCKSSHIFFTNLTAGTNYKLRVFRTSENLNNDMSLFFSVRVKEKPANDDCSSAQPIIVSTNEIQVNHNIYGASVNNDNNQENCNGTAQYFSDIWYEFTMPINGKLIISQSVGVRTLALYDDCLGTQIQCGSSTQFANLTAETTYKLQLTNDFNFLNGGVNNTYFKYFIVSSSLNDTCSTSEHINITTSNTTVNYNIDNAEIEPIAICNGLVFDSADIWYDFTMPVDGNIVIDTAFGNDNYYQLFDACGETQLNCGENKFVFHNLSAGTNYKLRLFRFERNLFEDFWDQTFNIKVAEIRSNNDCSNSENITVSSTPLEIFTNFGGSSLNNNIECASSTNVTNVVDLWYDFTMPIDGVIKINEFNPGNGNYFALYDYCSGTQIGCFADQANFINLTMGTNYKLRVFDNNAFGSNVDFTIEAASFLGVDNKTLQEAISVYPNPANDHITISTSNNQNITSIDFYDLFGKKVLETTDYQNIDIRKLESGIYLIQIKTNIGSATKRIIIK